MRHSFYYFKTRKYFQLYWVKTALCFNKEVVTIIVEIRCRKTKIPSLFTDYIYSQLIWMWIIIFVKVRKHPQWHDFSRALDVWKKIIYLVYLITMNYILHFESITFRFRIQRNDYCALFYGKKFKFLTFEVIIHGSQLKYSLLILLLWHYEKSIVESPCNDFAKFII